MKPEKIKEFAPDFENNNFHEELESIVNSILEDIKKKKNKKRKIVKKPRKIKKAKVETIENLELPFTF